MSIQVNSREIKDRPTYAGKGGGGGFTNLVRNSSISQYLKILQNDKKQTKFTAYGTIIHPLVPYFFIPYLVY